MAGTNLQSKYGKYKAPDVDTAIYNAIAAKRMEIDAEFRRMLGSVNDGLKVLEEKLEAEATGNVFVRQEIGYLVLGLAHSYVKNEDYEKALKLLNKYNKYAVEVAGTKSTPRLNGLLYIAFLHSLIPRKRGKQRKNNLNAQYYANARGQIHLTHASLKKLMIGTRTG